jgi:hypothetical protein
MHQYFRDSCGTDCEVGYEEQVTVIGRRSEQEIEEQQQSVPAHAGLVEVTNLKFLGAFEH